MPTRGQAEFPPQAEPRDQPTFAPRRAEIIVETIDGESVEPFDEEFDEELEEEEDEDSGTAVMLGLLLVGVTIGLVAVAVSR